jgi:hypothetical protein
MHLKARYYLFRLVQRDDRQSTRDLNIVGYEWIEVLAVVAENYICRVPTLPKNLGKFWGSNGSTCLTTIPNDELWPLIEVGIYKEDEGEV